MQALLAEGERTVVATPFGEVEAIAGALDGTPVVLVPRHGFGHARLPHEVNYRGNVWALRELGARAVFATCASGSLRADLQPGNLAVITDFLDFTRARAQTFRGAPGLPDAADFYHVDLQPPYCPRLQATLREAAGESLGEGTYACVEGPRYESPAEIRMFARLGADLVGMTGLPEAVLARELGLCYAALAIVTNAAAGLSDQPLEHCDVERRVAQAAERVASILAGAAERVAAGKDCCPAVARARLLNP